MNCPIDKCNERLQMQGGQFIARGAPVTHGFCRAHGQIRFMITTKTKIPLPGNGRKNAQINQISQLLPGNSELLRV